MHKFLFRITFVFSLLIGCLGVNVQASDKPDTDSVVIFRFMARNDTFWASYKGNEKEFVRLANFIQNNREMIMRKTMPIFVNGYCASFPDAETNKKIAKIRSNHVKSYVIVNFGLKEDHFKTVNYTTPYKNSLTDIVTLTFRFNREDFTKVIMPPPSENIGAEVTEEVVETPVKAVEKPTIIPMKGQENAHTSGQVKHMPSDKGTIPAPVFVAPSKDSGGKIRVKKERNKSEKPDRIKSEKSAKADKVVKVKTEKPVKVKAEKPIKVKAEKPVKEKVDKPIKVKAEKPIKIKAEKPIKIKAEKPAKVKTEKPIKVKKEKSVKVKAVKGGVGSVIGVAAGAAVVGATTGVINQEQHSIVNKPLEYEITSDEITKKLKDSNKNVVKEEKTKPIKTKPVVTKPLKPAKTVKPSIAVKSDKLVDFELKTNLLYLVATAPNIEFEVLLKQKWSLNLEYQFAHTDFDSGNKHFRLSFFSPELRYYPIAGRLFVGAYYNTGMYNFKFADFGYQGDVNGGGITVGYKVPVTKAIGFEFSISGGYAWSNFDKYRFEDGCNRFEMNNGKNYFGPTKAKVSFIWRIGGGKK